MSERPAHQATTSSLVVTDDHEAGEEGPSSLRPSETVTIRHAAAAVDNPSGNPSVNPSGNPSGNPTLDSTRPPATTVRWSQDVVDNEHMNKKKSKKCCIYHKPRVFGEWSDTDSDDERGCHDCGG